MTIQNFDERRNIFVAGNKEETIEFCTRHFIETAKRAIAAHGLFSVALSGGSTPAAIFKNLSKKENADKIDYSKVWLFWSDERSVPLDDPESNYKMAMDAGFNSLPIPKNQIFPMQGPFQGIDELELNAKVYEALIKKIPSGRFDLVMLGMGDDGHTASLFPQTAGLHVKNRLAIANFVPQKNTWRLTLTFDCINQANEIVIYVLGKSKAKMVKEVLNSPYTPEDLPIQAIGTPTNKALWILDEDAASELI